MSGNSGDHVHVECEPYRIPRRVLERGRDAVWQAAVAHRAKTTSSTLPGTVMVRFRGYVARLIKWGVAATHPEPWDYVGFSQGIQALRESNVVVSILRNPLLLGASACLVAEDLHLLLDRF